jgi:hypothetical protein
MHERTKFLYNEEGRPIGRATESGAILTLRGKPSQQYLPTPSGVALNKAHAERVKALQFETGI